MLGLKSFRTAAIVIGGIELVEKSRRASSKSESSADQRRQYRISGKLPWLRSLTLSHFNNTKPSDFGLILNLQQNQNKDVRTRLPLPIRRRSHYGTTPISTCSRIQTCVLQSRRWISSQMRSDLVSYIHCRISPEVLVACGKQQIFTAAEMFVRRVRCNAYGDWRN